MPNYAELPGLFWALLFFFFALGIFFRVYGVGARSLWTDEAWVALAATQPTPAAALAGGKSTPPLYLLTVWVLVQLLGASETVLRLTSVLFGIGALLLFWPLASRLLPPWPAVAACALVSVSPRLVYFSKELKQYSADVFFAVLAFWLVERQLRRGGQGGWLGLTAALALGLGFSFPLVFVLPVAAGVLWWHLPGARRAVAWSFGTLALVFLLFYLFLVRGQVDPELLLYWQADFPELSGLGPFFTWLGAAWWRFGRYFFADWRVLPGTALVVLGLVATARQGRARVIWYFLGPLLLALAAAFAHRYPFMGRAGGVRLMLFAAPMLYLATGAGIGALGGWLWRLTASRQAPPAPVDPAADPRPPQLGRRATAVCLLGLYLLAVFLWLRPVFLWQENLRPEMNREEIAPLIRYLETHRRPGDAIYLYYFAIDPFRFYYRGPYTDIIYGQSCHDCGLPLPAARLAQIQRLWLVFSHFETEADVERFIANLLGQGWTQELSLAQPGALLRRYRPPWAAADALNLSAPE
ncbi:MAG: glycosyltransferase family 39 protein [Desulfobacca sp.]|uniref:glycosyltransferase family 39 protein n=1 Tax=Desulfobacca sp. TaxID=2067990 RepID=UPI004049C7DB